MKKIIIALSFMLTCFGVSAQESKYDAAMKGMLTKLTAANTTEMLEPLANGFDRIAAAETNKWLPLYYAAYCQVMQALMEKDKTKIDPLVDLAEKNLEKAKGLSESEEITCLRALCKSARIGVDPMSRGMRYSAESKELLTFAKKVNPSNPRIYLLEAQSVYYTPEAFGGGKDKARPLYELALSKFREFKPQNELMPNWGLEQVRNILESYNK